MKNFIEEGGLQGSPQELHTAFNIALLAEGSSSFVPNSTSKTGIIGPSLDDIAAGGWSDIYSGITPEEALKIVPTEKEFQLARDIDRFATPTFRERFLPVAQKALALTSVLVVACGLGYALDNLIHPPVVFADASSDGNGPGCVLPTPPNGVEFKLGFKALAEQVPCIVGTPLENEHWGANGDSLQQTSNGLMAWRKADNWTAFTDGSRTWVNGPAGVQDRDNNVRFIWEAQAAPATIKPEVAGVQVTPVPTATAEPKINPPQEIIRNMFTDTYPLPSGLIRRHFTPSEVTNIDGIEFRGREFMAADYAKNVMSTIKKVPEYEALVKRSVKSVEVSDSSLASNAQAVINDILGDGGNFLSVAFNIPDTFSVSITAADLVYNAKLTEIAANGSNKAGRTSIGPIKDPVLEKSRQIKNYQATVEGCRAAVDFATKAKLAPGIIDNYQQRKQGAENQLRSLQ